MKSTIRITSNQHQNVYWMDIKMTTYRLKTIKSVSIQKNIKYRDNEENHQSYIKSVSWKQRTKYGSDDLYQRNHIEKVTVYNMSKSYKGTDFSYKKQKRKTKKVIKFFKNF